MTVSHCQVADFLQEMQRICFSVGACNRGFFLLMLLLFGFVIDDTSCLWTWVVPHESSHFWYPDFIWVTFPFIRFQTCHKEFWIFCFNNVLGDLLHQNIIITTCGPSNFQVFSSYMWLAPIISESTGQRYSTAKSTISGPQHVTVYVWPSVDAAKFFFPTCGTFLYPFQKWIRISSALHPVNIWFCLSFFF